MASLWFCLQFLRAFLLEREMRITVACSIARRARLEVSDCAGSSHMVEKAKRPKIEIEDVRQNKDPIGSMFPKYSKRAT